MRLIDADELLERIDRSDVSSREKIIDVIRNAPNIKYHMGFNRLADDIIHDIKALADEADKCDVKNMLLSIGQAVGRVESTIYMFGTKYDLFFRNLWGDATDGIRQLKKTMETESNAERNVDTGGT